MRDRRNKGWFFVDNDYLNGFAKYFGPTGTSVYLSLCRHADGEQKAFPSQRLIAEEVGCGERTVRDYINALAKYHLIEVHREKNSDGKWLNNVYTLLAKEEWIKPQAVIASGGKGVEKSTNQRQLTTKPEAVDDRNQRQPLPHKDTNRKDTHIRKERKITNSEDEQRRIADIKRGIRELVGSKSVR